MLEVVILVLSCALVFESVALVRLHRSAAEARLPRPAAVRAPPPQQDQAVEHGRPGGPAPGQDGRAGAGQTGAAPAADGVREDSLLPEGILRQRARRLEVMDLVESGVTARDLDAIQGEATAAVQQFAAKHQLGPHVTEVTIGVIEEYLWSLNGSKLLLVTGLRNEETETNRIARERDRCRRTLAAVVGPEMGNDLEMLAFTVWESRWHAYERRDPAALPAAPTPAPASASTP